MNSVNKSNKLKLYLLLETFMVEIESIDEEVYDLTLDFVDKVYNNLSRADKTLLDNRKGKFPEYVGKV